jgi:hypothetical protein
MRLRSHRRNLVVWSSSGGPVSPHGVPRLTRVARTRRVRRCIRTAGLLAVIGMIRLARAARIRWRPLLAVGALTVVSVMLRGSAGSTGFLPGAWFLLVALLTTASSKAASTRRSELQRELAAYSTPAQRRDLEATLDLYPDNVTHELRNILASQSGRL